MQANSFSRNDLPPTTYNHDNGRAEKELRIEGNGTAERSSFMSFGVSSSYLFFTVCLAWDRFRKIYFTEFFCFVSLGGV